ncbi:ABC transporter substrate-binding protein [Bacillus marinisedimentorum]|uniref:ABC transporter substrate-binding protein n=1 Tax=Bacillus marinisedimentorum TaxID=1821260 RepID=UPI0007E17C03|nr:extracellular solute-binding protein [Bacillus marinisedimentorum]
MNLKKSLLVGLLLSLSVLLFACSSDEETSGNKDGGDVKLDFWVFGATNYEELAKEYEKENPNVKINIRKSQLEDHHNSLFTAISSGSGAPDLTMIEIDQLDRYREAQDRFVNLYDLGAEEVQDKYLDWKWATAENAEGDFLFGLPTDIGPKAMYYNVDVFAEAGLPTEPEKVTELISTPEAFKEAAAKVADTTGKPMVDSMEMAFRAHMDALETSYFNREGDLLIDNNDNGVKEAYDYAVELNEQGYVGEFDMWTPEWANALNKGDFAVEMGAAWLKGYMTENAVDAKGKWRVTTLPEDFAGNWGGSYIAIPAESKQSEEAYNFAKWLVNPDNQLKSFVDSGLFPSAPAVYEMEEFKQNSDEYFGGQNTAEYFAKAAEDIPAVYKGPKYVTVNNEVLAALKNVQQGGDPQEEWDAAVERIKGLLKK